MKRNSMLTKIIAVLLCALMVAAWLPKTSAAANDFESDMDRDNGTHAGNAIDLLIGTNEDAGLADTYYAYTPAEDGTLTLTAEDGTTFTVNGVAYADAVAVTAGTEYIIVATNAALAHSFTAAFEVPPAGLELVIGTNANEGAEVTYTYTATADGRVKLSATDGTTFTVDGVACYNSFAVVSGTTYTVVASNANGAHSFEAKYLAYNHELFLSSQGFRIVDSIQGSLVVNTRVKTTATDDRYKFDQVWLEATYISGAGEPKVDVLTTSASATTWVFYYNLTPAELVTIREITVHAIKDGVEYVNEDGWYADKNGNSLQDTAKHSYVMWSGKTLLLKLFDSNYANKDNNEEARLLCVMLADMLYYADESQKTLDMNTETPATAGVNADYLAMATQNVPTINASLSTATSGNFRVKAVNLRLVDKIQMTVACYTKSGAATSDYQIKIGDTVYSSTDTDVFKGSGANITVFAGVKASELREPLTVEFLKDGVVQNTAIYTISIEAACTNYINKGVNVDLCKAIMKYGDAADAYFTCKNG